MSLTCKHQVMTDKTFLKRGMMEVNDIYMCVESVYWALSRDATSPRFLESESSPSPHVSSPSPDAKDSSPSPSPAGFESESESRLLCLESESESRGEKLTSSSTRHLSQYHE